MKCEICGNKVSIKNDGNFLREFLTKKEVDNIPTKCICVSCKKELLFSGILAVI